MPAVLMPESCLRARCARYVRGSHAPARLFAGLAFLGTAVGVSTPVHALELLAATLAMLLLLGLPVRHLLRAMKVLTFLMLPILILHMWLTPGRLWLAGISVEGLALGGWLSLHLALMYFAAMLFSRLITLPEWMALTALCGGRRLQAHLMLLMPLARQVRWRMQWLGRQWRRRGSWRQLAPSLAAVMGQCLSVSQRQADALWLRWPAGVRPAGFFAATVPLTEAWPATLVLVLIGAGVLAGGR
jgi:hypothetical protein